MKETNPPLRPGKTSSAAAKTPAPAESAHHDLTGSDLETFLDGFMPTQLAREDIAGAVVAVVKDGKVISPRAMAFPMSRSALR